MTRSKPESSLWMPSRLINARMLTEADVQVARYVAGSVVSEPSDRDLLSLAVAVGATQRGHVCADLNQLDKFAPIDEIHGEVAGSRQQVPWPTIEEWESHLASSELVQMASSWEEAGSTQRPLMFFEGRLYLSRQWEDERIVAAILGRRLNESATSADESVVEATILQLFPDAEPGDEQTQAVRRSLANRTSILMGGPGTGKTYTIARILSAHLGLHTRLRGSDEPLRIALAAPTAKAAAQMRESLMRATASGSDPLPEDHAKIFSQLEPTTIHGLLGRRRRLNTRFAHDAENQLDVDLLIIDEMSMVSLALMARLAEALRPETCVVLVGDPGQLASVENGSILWDLARLEDQFGDRITRLKISHRNQLTISSTFTDAVRDANRQQVENILSSAPDSEEKTFSFIEMENGLRKSNKHRFRTIVDLFAPVREVAVAGDVDTALVAAAAIRIVCAHRRGAFGVEEWNKFINEELFDDSSTWTPGQIVIKTRNDPANGLANGDTGIVISSRDTAEATLEFAFARGNVPLRKPTAAVDDIELAFGTTVHKAQGSEFGTVVVIVPPKSSPLCTRELLYTASTRAKPNLILIGHRDDVLYAVETERPRFSGLVKRLQQPLA